MCFALSGGIAGVISSWVYKLFKGNNWLGMGAVTSVLLPAFTIVCFFIIEVVDWYERSSDVLPVSLTFVVVFASMLLNIFLVFSGAFVGSWETPFQLPVSTSRHQRPLPRLPVHLWPLVTHFLYSVPPGAIIMTQLLLLVQSVWRESYYQLPLFMLLAIVLMTVASGLVSVIQTYLLVSSGYHKWQWRSFTTGFAVSLWVAAAMLLYYFNVLTFHLKLAFTAGTVIYCVFTAFVSVVIGLVNGSVSYLSSLLFLSYLYSAKNLKD